MHERHPLLLLDSIGRITPAAAGHVIVSGSHGGTAAADYVIEQRPAFPRACLFNDAGVGKESAGIAGLAMLDAHGVIAATCSHLTARIGDAADALACGRLSHVNATASRAGLVPGMMVSAAVRLLAGDAAAPPPEP